jgi:hypothetical protein
MARRKLWLITQPERIAHRIALTGCEYRLLANNHNVESALHHRKVEIILELHGH